MIHRYSGRHAAPAAARLSSPARPRAALGPRHRPRGRARLRRVPRQPRRGGRACRGGARPRRRGGPRSKGRARRISGLALSGHRQAPRCRLGEPRAGARRRPGGDRADHQADRHRCAARAAAAAELAKGDRLRLIVGHRTVELQVDGVVDLKGVEALTDIATAQWRLERLGQLNRLDVRLKRGADREAVRLRIAALLPPGVHVAPVQALEQASSYPSRAYGVNLDVLAMVALFTGGFLVFSAQALQVARRRGEHALLRVLGLRRRGVLQLVLLEAAALGAIGGLVGLALGYALALAAVRASGADLGAGVFRGLSPKLDFSLVPAFFYLAAGIAVAAAGALLPALDAARQAPAQALKAGDEQRLFARLSSPWPGLAFILAGAALAQLGPVGGLPIYGYAAIGCLLIGSIALMPRLSQAVFDALPLPRQPRSEEHTSELQSHVNLV